MEQKYITVPLNQIHYQIQLPDDESASKENELLMHQGSRYPPREKRAAQLLKKLRPSYSLLNLFLLLVIIGLFVKKRWTTRDYKYGIGGDITGFTPRFPQSITTFKPDLPFVPSNVAEFWSKEVEEKWLSIVLRSLDGSKLKTCRSTITLRRLFITTPI
ncbi:hypothetical protein GQ43DRAFT_306315 [Delitschia confertaspora ATCC 74209]|uniref:Uncharacterized protein n=1 Tax=Delitschia confertaspora ATCC 74209 TaxID=1513339 RepID=A0A9P4JNK1_9PLEO|nr:hypothetical protein GQ43DRAFT_306315 [Delitschia confertaspora ATCC 74209]